MNPADPYCTRPSTMKASYACQLQAANHSTACAQHATRRLSRRVPPARLAQADPARALQLQAESPTDNSVLSRRQQLLGITALLGAGAWIQPSSATAAPPPYTAPGAPVATDGEAILISPAEVATLTPSEKQVYSQNRRIQAQNRTPADFPGFIRTGFDVKVVGDNIKSTPSGLFYQDFDEGIGTTPVDGQEVVFHYTGYNESGTVIDSSYRQGRPAQTRLGIAGMIPGFEEGIRGMRVGQTRRIIVPPALGPPVGPSTFFSAKQCEVFDVELLAIRTCKRRQMAMFSDVVCE